MQIKLLLSRPKGGLLTKIGQIFIRLAGRSSMSHCALQFGNYVYECTISGVQPPIYFYDWILRQESAKSADVKTSSADYTRCLDLAKSYVGIGYDMGANIGQALNSGKFERGDKLNCVEHVNEILAIIGLNPFAINKQSGRSPGDFEALQQYKWLTLT